MSQNSSDGVDKRLYFAYGSNLSLVQMQTRCPGSTYYGFGVLKGWRWLINERGYANVVEIEAGNDKVRGEAVAVKRPNEKLGGNEGREGEVQDEETAAFVEGMLYTLTERDEARLDAAEGVPFAYTKILLDIELLSTVNSESDVRPLKASVNIAGGRVRVVKALVYVDLKRRKESVCQDEYVARMNRGIADAREKGMSERYIKTVLRKWIAEEKEDGDKAGEIEDPFAPSDELEV